MDFTVQSEQMLEAAPVQPLGLDWDVPAWRVTVPGMNWSIDVGAADEQAAKEAVVPHVARELRRRAGVAEPAPPDRVDLLASAIEKAETPDAALAAMKTWAADSKTA